MRQHGPLGLLAALALLCCSVDAAKAQAEPELLRLDSSWPTAQELLNLPDWMALELSVTAEPLFNPLGGRRSAGSWIQQGTANLELSTGLDRPTSSWRELDHWQVNATVNHDIGDAFYNTAIGALFSLQQVAYPAGFYLSNASIERQRGDGWLNIKAGILPINPDFVEVPVLGNYVHSAFNNTLNITVVDLPINPFSAVGGVVGAQISPELNLRYGLYDLSSTDTISRWLGIGNDILGPDSGTAQFLQLTFEPASMASRTLQACRTERGVVRWGNRQPSCPNPVRVQNQLHDGVISLGGFATSDDGNGIYGSVTLPSGLPLGLDNRVWIGGSYSPDGNLDVSPIFIGGGMVIQGPLPNRPLDVVVLGLGRSDLSNELITSPYEAMLELGYRIQFNDSLNLQPTLQWIFNPSGAGEPVAGILAGGVQIQVNF